MRCWVCLAEQVRNTALSVALPMAGWYPMLPLAKPRHVLRCRIDSDRTQAAHCLPGRHAAHTIDAVDAALLAASPSCAHSMVDAACRLSYGAGLLAPA